MRQAESKAELIQLMGLIETMEPMTHLAYPPLICGAHRRIAPFISARSQ
jgi:hypothetical protein